MVSPRRPNRTGRAILAIVTSVSALSLGDALIKATGLSLPLWQMYILRSALTLPVLLWLAWRRGPISVTAPLWVAIRSLLLVAMWLSYYVALPRLPLSLAAAAYYTGPLFILAISAVVARQWPGNRALIAIVAGFLGVLLIIRPDAAGFQTVTLLPVLAALLYAAAMMITSVKCREDSPFVLALALNLAFVIAGLCLGLFSGQKGAFLFGPWQPVDAPLALTVATLAGLLLVGSVGAAIAYQEGPPTTVAAFDYSYLAFSLLWGAIFFGERPGAIALTGICIIVGAGLLALPRRNRD
ncbi:MAG: DMT family transporter [Albidovulum sp.]|uniref:DMT family transporter n=1 Tax=Albidovulum sp. TaxID=1872424 RepID=UPI003C943F27